MGTLMASDLALLLRTLEPHWNAGVYVYASLPAGVAPGALPVLGSFREREGWTVIMEESAAAAAGLDVLFRAAWLTLTVQSDLAAVGLTAAFAQALGEHGISCNVVAAAHHDHLFVPADQGAAALACLRELQRASAH